MKNIFLVLFIALSTPVKAGDVDHLISLIGVEIMLEKAYEECLKGSESLLSEELNIESQSKTLGIDRQHKYWGDLEAIFTEFYTVSCEYVSVEESIKIWRTMYSNRLSEKEIVELIKFYSSPVGKKLIQLDIEANTKVQEVMNSRYAKLASKAQRIYEYRINKLMQKMQSEEHNQAFQRTQSLTRLVR